MFANTETDGLDCTLSTLCNALRSPARILGRPEIRIVGVTDDSRQVSPGYLFAALRGTRTDGHDPRYIRQAVENGAAAILTEREQIECADVTRVCVPDTRPALAQIAARFYNVTRDLDSGAMRLIGVTGTNGKSTVCRLIQAALNAGGRRCANLGTIEYDLIGRRSASVLTTPGSIELARLIAESRRHCADRLCLEVSSHALDQCRTDGLTFSTAIFTNLSGDHYDYHGGQPAYLRAKKRLFDGLDADAVAVVNVDDPVHRSIVADCRARLIRYGLSDSADLRADVRGMAASGTALTIHHKNESFDVSVPIVGRYNVYNILAAFAAGMADGIDAETVLDGVRSVTSIAGRLERVGGADCPIDVFVDYAHTDDALGNVLSAARQVCRGRLIVVFGCGGDRDRSKRPRMARVAAELADEVVITSDNPRSEDPMSIIDEVRSGLSAGERAAATVEPDRERAIELAIHRARPGDLVLIAGKGHEDYQIIGDRRRWFDDRVAAARVLEQAFGVQS